MPEAPFVLFGTRIYQVWNDLDILLGEHPHYSNHPDHTASNEPVLTDAYGNVIISENDTVIPIRTNLPLKAGIPVDPDDVVTKGWAQAGTGFLMQDGSTPLTADWDVGATNDILTDAIKARSGSGLQLHNNADNGWEISDGDEVGYVVGGSPVFVIDSDGNVTLDGELNGAPFSFILSNSAGGSVTTAGIYLKAGEIPMTATKGLVMRKAGSIIGVSIQYDITVDNTDIELQVHKNGANVWGNAINDSVAADKKDSFTQTRDTDTFVAEDIITVVVIAPSGPGPWTDIDDMIVTLDVVYD